MKKKKTTMQDIANELNVSRMTVSKAFKESNDISLETKRKIIQKANELGYNYKTPSNMNVLVLTNQVFLELDERFYIKVYKKLIKHSATKDITMSMCVVTEHMEINLIAPTISESEFDGLMLLGELSETYIELLTNLHLPMVFVDFYNNMFKYDTIVTNNYLYSYEITSHLIAMGHKKIGFVGNIKYTSSVQDRYLGYYKALLENNLTLDESLIIHDRDCNGLLTSFKLPENLPTAFVCNNDYTAYNLIDYLGEKNLKVPDDISVIGFDDVLDSRIRTHQLTTVHVNIDDMVHISIQRMIDNITKKTLTPKTYVINSTIIFRDSVKQLI